MKGTKVNVCTFFFSLETKKQIGEAKKLKQFTLFERLQEIRMADTLAVKTKYLIVQTEISQKDKEAEKKFAGPPQFENLGKSFIKLFFFCQNFSLLKKDPVLLGVPGKTA